MVSPSKPELTASERISEIAALLATALVRIQFRKSSNKVSTFGESSLHILANQSGVRPIPENGKPQ